MKLSDKGIVIRKTSETDLHQIYIDGKSELTFNDISFSLNPENLAEIYSSESSIYYTAVRKKKVLGFIIGSVNNGTSQIHWMMVKENFRKAGIGKELLNSYIDTSKKSGAEKFIIAVLRNSAESVKFFSNNGFIENESFIELQFKP